MSAPDGSRFSPSAERAGAKPFLLALALSACLVPFHAAAQSSYQLGKKLSERDISAWNIDVSPSGAGLPAGKGSVAEGKIVYESRCAACHGMKGEGKPADRLVGGVGSLNSGKPIRTVGSFWPYATTIYDYVFRAMPYDRPQSLTPGEVYAVTAYLLYLNGIVDASATLDAASLPKVKMPNQAGFVADPRPDVVNTPCMKACR
jgi:S-disulfanyl-L-cysteine oxidoreductase SoxD